MSSPLIERIGASGRVPFEEARGLPFAAYRDPALFEAEMEAVFHCDWVPVCGVAELSEPGDRYALRVGHEPVVVVRGGDGELRALSNVCRHRGTPLADDGPSRADKLVCPYHAWSYDDVGRLRGVPHPGRVEVDKEAHCLPRFQLEVWHGIVWVCLDPHATPLRERVAGLGRYLDRYELDRFTEASPTKDWGHWKANWKLIVENGIESYHVFQVHPATFEVATPTRSAFYMEGNASWSLTAGGGIVSTPSPHHPKEIGEFEHGHYVLVSIPPAFVAIVTPDSWGWLSVQPWAPDETKVTLSSLSPPQRGPRSAAAEAAIDEYVAKFMAEDQWINERAQRGMSSRGEGGQLVDLERIVIDFHRYLAWRLAGVQPQKSYVAPEAVGIAAPAA